MWRFGLNWIRRGLRLAAPSLLFAEWTRRATTARGCYDCCRLSSECDQKNYCKRVELSHDHLLLIVGSANLRSGNTVPLPAHRSSPKTLSRCGETAAAFVARHGVSESGAPLPCSSRQSTARPPGMGSCLGERIRSQEKNNHSESALSVFHRGLPEGLDAVADSSTPVNAVQPLAKTLSSSQ